MAWCQRCDDKYLIISSPKVGAGGIVICDLLLFSHSVMFNSATSWTAACQVSLTLTISWSLLKLKSIESSMPSNHLILCHPLLPDPPTFSLSQHQALFQGVSSLHQVSKYWSFSFSISTSNEYSGLISFRMDWLDLLAIQGTLRSLPQHHSSKASVLQHSVFFMVQLSHPYMTAGETTALTRQTFGFQGNAFSWFSFDHMSTLFQFLVLLFF